MIIKPYGQGRLVEFFKKALANGSLSHAYMIEGDTGSGKKTLARYFAALALCKNGCGCGECDSCRQIAADANPDLITVSAEDGKATIGVDTVRNMISTVSYRAINGERRVYIIEDADLLTAQAQNALLKVIEEPPKNVMFFLLCRQKGQMLRTIKSRVQTLKLAPLSKDDLLKIAPDCNDFQIAYSNGNPGKLLKISANDSFQELRNSAVDSIGRFFTGNDECFYETADLFEKNKDFKEDLFTIVLYTLRDVMYKKLKLQRLIINSDKLSVIDSISQKISPINCMRAINAVLDAEKGMGKYGNYNLAVQTMLIKMKK